jgi:hypothetical protein
MDMDPQGIVADLTAVTKKWTKQRKAEERNRNARSRRNYIYTAPPSFKDAMTVEVVTAAYMKASANSTLPAFTRQIYYPARGPIQEIVGKPLDGKYFSQKLLPPWVNAHSNLTADWDIVYDSRGNFLEPHTGVKIPLGTINVRQYLDGGLQDAVSRVRGLFPTRDPGNRFGAVLFIEKEGFFPLFHRVRLAERFDLAIMSTKGLSVIAARKLVDRLCGGNGIPLLVMHDFDKNGFSTLGTLTRSNERYRFRNKVQVIDIGVRLEDVLKYHLPSEDVVIGDSRKFRDNLRRNGATAEEVKYLLAGQRNELNGFTSSELIGWMEGKFQEHGIKKVVPDQDTLGKAYRRAFVRQHVRNGIPDLVREARDYLRENGRGVPNDLHERVVAMITRHPAEPWDGALARVAEEILRETDL